MMTRVNFCAGMWCGKPCLLAMLATSSAGQTEGGELALLTIAVPTYNRGDKLEGTLRSICSQIQSSPKLVDEVKIVVSDNGSTDTTPNVLTRFDAGPVSFRFFRQNDNFGLDRNMRFLYQACGSDYIWFFSD